MKLIVKLSNQIKFVKKEVKRFGSYYKFSWQGLICKRKLFCLVPPAGFTSSTKGKPFIRLSILSHHPLIFRGMCQVELSVLISGIYPRKTYPCQDAFFLVTPAGFEPAVFTVRG